MKKWLLSIAMLSLVGCGDVSGEDLPKWNDNLTLVESFSYNNNIYLSSKGNCYLQYYYVNRGSVSKVDCEDFNVKQGDYIEEQSKPLVASSTELLEYLVNYCVVNNEYNGFPRVKGDSVIKELQGKQLSCKLPDNIDKSINERAEYTRLKNKFEGK